MRADDFEDAWRTLNPEMLAEMTAWRRAHPRATFQEIEQAVDQRIAQTRARLLEHVTQASPAADWRAAPPEDQPTCPACGTRLRPNGTYTRHLQTHGGQALALERSYGVCPACGTGFFPPR
jgi:YgiT-type zinc finger domain-containing protein